MALGDIRAARTVATWLLDHPETPGAHRIVRADGRPITPTAIEVLQREGITLRHGRVTADRFVDDISGVPILESLREEQRELSFQVVEADVDPVPQTYGGVDVAYKGDRAFAAAVSLDATTLETTEISEAEIDVDFPYIPTYLAFREFPAVHAAFAELRDRPDLLFVDGHGRLHPALFGFACFAGVRLNVPTIGIAKHPLAGRPNASADTVLGAIPIDMEGTTRGYAWTPPGASHPFYVSVGHRISLSRSLEVAQRATRRRYPEPLAVADRLSKERKVEKNGERSASGKTARLRPPAQGRKGV